MLGDFEVDIISGRKRKDFAGQRVLVAVKPLRSGDESVVFLQLLEAVVGAALLADSDDVARLHKIGRDVDALAVDGVVAMVHELTGLAAGRGKAKAIDHVVKTALDKAQKDLTGVALSAGSLLIIHPELLLQDAVNKLDLLLLGELQSIFGLLSSSLTAGILIGSQQLFL